MSNDPHGYIKLARHLGYAAIAVVIAVVLSLITLALGPPPT